MICFFCHRRITGQDMAHRYEWRQGRPGEDLRVYGEDAPDGKLKDAKGSMVKTSHRKCYHADKKRNELAAAKAADPSSHAVPDQDWRHQEVHDVEDLTGNEGHRDHRGAGAAGQ